MSVVFVEAPRLDFGKGWSLWFQGLHQAHVCQLSEDMRLARAKHLMDSAYAEPLSLNVVAGYAWMSTYHFLRCFKKRYGVTPHQYLTQVRVQKARWFLEHSEQSVTEICANVGFESLGSFSSMFRRYVGEPPSHYRKRSWLVQPILPPAWVPFCFMPS